MNNDKSLEQWLWDAACSIRGAKDAPKYKDYILPLVFAKRLCDVFDDEVNRIAKEVGGRAKAFKLIERDHRLVRFYIPLQPANPDELVWSVIRKLADKIGEQLTDHLRAVARENPRLQGIIDRVDFNATTHGQRDISDDRLSALIERMSLKRLGLNDVEPDIIGRSYEYLIRKFAEGSGQSAGEFYTPKEVGMVMARIIQPAPGMTVYDPCCGSGGLLIKCQLVSSEALQAKDGAQFAPLKLYGQEYIANTWAMANMNMIIHDMEGEVEIGDTFKSPKFRDGGKLKTFDRVLTNPMWNQDWFTEKDYDADELGRFPKGAGFPGKSSADWGWVQHVLASLNNEGRAAIVLDIGAASRGSGERNIRKWFIENDFVEGVIYLPENLFYNNTAPGLILFLNKAKSIEHKGKLFLLNASREFRKGDPKNYITDDGIACIAETFNAWREVDKYSLIVNSNEIAKNDYNISPSRYIQTGEWGRHRSILDIRGNLEQHDAAAQSVNRELEVYLQGLEVGTGKYRNLEFIRIPDDWNSGMLGREEDPIITLVRNGLTIPQDKSHGDYKITRIETIGDGYIDENRVGYVSNVNEKTVEEYLIQKGDILFSHINSEPHIGKTAIALQDYSDLLHGMNLLLIRPNPQVIDPYFLHLVFCFYRQTGAFVKICSRAVNQSSINQKKLRALEIPLPPVPIQKNIVRVLSTTQAVIEQHTRLMELTSELKSLLINQLLTGQMSTGVQNL